MSEIWKRITEAFEREPVTVINSIVGLVEAVIVVLTVSGAVEISTETKAAIVGLTVAIATVIQTTLARSRVSPAEGGK